MAIETDIREALRRVVDPELGVNIVDLGLVYRINVEGACARITMTMTSPACPLAEYLKDLVTSAIREHLSDVVDVEIFPAVLGLPLEYRPTFYLHVGVLHLSLILRVVGDLVDSLGRWRVWGGLLNAAALLLFMVNTGRSMAFRGNHADAI